MKGAAAIILLIFSGALHAAQPALQFNETMNDKVKVSGRFHAGIQIYSQEVSDKLFVMIPPGTATQLCIDITSIDGIYRAEIVYELVDNLEGYTEFNFPSQYKKELMEYSPMELALKATIGDNCDDQANTNVLASWGEHPNAEDLILLIRSDARRDVAHIPDISSSELKVKCQKIEASYNVAYDKFCLFEGVSPAAISSIEIERKNLRKIPSVKFELGAYE